MGRDKTEWPECVHSHNMLILETCVNRTCTYYRDKNN